MANINIMDKLGKETQTITLAEGKTYEVDCAAETMLVAQEKFKNGNVELSTLFEVIEILLGENALMEVKTMKPTVKQLQVIITAILAQVNEVSYEEMEKRFRNN